MPLRFMELVDDMLKAAVARAKKQAKADGLEKDSPQVKEMIQKETREMLADPHFRAIAEDQLGTEGYIKLLVSYHMDEILKDPWFDKKIIVYLRNFHKIKRKPETASELLEILLWEDFFQTAKQVKFSFTPFLERFDLQILLETKKEGYEVKKGTLNKKFKLFNTASYLL